MNIKLILITWSYEDFFDLKNTPIYKSYIINNSEKNLIHFHFNRNNFINLEQEFNERFGHQYDFLLYRIYLIRDKLKNVESDFFIFSDVNDVVCFGDILDIKNINSITFSAERHQYPNNTNDWIPVNSYPISNIKSNTFLNAGLQISKKQDYLNLLDSVIENILSLNLKNFGGDQGVYTFHFINDLNPKINLDEDRDIFVSTYFTSHDWYEVNDGKIIYKPTNKMPMFLHDNGWNYGSPKIIENFKLV